MTNYEMRIALINKFKRYINLRFKKLNGLIDTNLSKLEDIVKCKKLCKKQEVLIKIEYLDMVQKVESIDLLKWELQDLNLILKDFKFKLISIDRDILEINY